MPRHIPLSESESETETEDDTSSEYTGQSNSNNSDSNSIGSNGFDNEEDDYPDAQNAFGGEEFGFDFDENHDDFLDTPVPRLTNDTGIGGGLAAATFGPDSTEQAKESSSTAKKTSNNKSMMSIATPSKASGGNGNNVAQLGYNPANVSDDSSPGSGEESSPDSGKSPPGEDNNSPSPQKKAAAVRIPRKNPRALPTTARNSPTNNKKRPPQQQQQPTDKSSSKSNLSEPNSKKPKPAATAKPPQVQAPKQQVPPKPPQVEEAPEKPVRSLTQEEKDIMHKEFMAKMKVNDDKLPQDRMRNMVTVLRSKLFISRMNLRLSKAEIVDLQAELDKMKEREAILLSDRKALQDQRVQDVTRSNAALLRMCNDQRKKARSIAKEELWRLRKFISCDKELDWCADYVLKRMGLEGYEKDSEAYWSWIETYKKTIKKGLFERRNYVTSELKKVVFEVLKLGKTPPTLATIVKCATRNIDPENKEDMENFMWYWETILPKMVGKSNWGDKNCYYSTISKAKTNEIKPKMVITFSSEAMICAIWDNNIDKWPELYDWTKLPENSGKDQPNWNGKYTSSDGGQSEWGGWSTDGLEAFNDYAKQIKAGRQSVRCLKLEEHTLQKLRERVGIVSSNHNATTKRKKAMQRRAKLNSKKPLPPLKEDRIVMTAVHDDEEEDDLMALESEDEERGVNRSKVV